jgi:hypothetical protein
MLAAHDQDRREPTVDRSSTLMNYIISPET